MNIDDICNLPVKNIASENCILFLWVTFPTLLDSFKVIEAWGFNYKTVAFVWVKHNKKHQLYFGAWDFGLEQMQKYVY